MKKFPWGHSRRYNAFPDYFKILFGSRIQKLSLDAGFTCPNRDGTKGTGGCTYCNNNAFSPSYCSSGESVRQQIEKGIEFHRKRYRKAGTYLAYFQTYSNTYAPISQLKALYENALEHPLVKGLVIGTRPDCIDEEKLSYLKELSSTHYIAIEYGIESCYDRTLQRINRGHTFADAEKAVKLTSSYGINTGAHFIFGLPGESRDEMMASAAIISRLPLKTVKFHQLQIIKGTAMEKEYMQKPEDFQLFTLDEYITFFVSFLERLNPDIVVERFTGEAPPRFLSETRWGIKRTEQIVSLVEKRLEELDTWQGRFFK